MANRCTRRVQTVLWILALAAPTPAPAEVLVDGIAAQVGSEIVLISDVRQISEPVVARLMAAGAPAAEIAKLRADVLESLVERALVRQMVRRSEIEATPAEVDAAIVAIGAENGLTPEQLRASVEAQGLSFASYRDKIAGEIEYNKVLNGMVASRVRIEEAELRALYEEEFAEQPVGGDEVHLRHLLVPFTSAKPAAQQAACERAEAAAARIAGGEAFPVVASQVSVVNPRQGGDLGWLHVASLASWMAPAVEALGEGGVSPVIRTAFGCNLLELVERRSYRRLTYAAVREGLRQRLFEEKQREEYMRFIGQLRAKTYIERKGFFADAALLGGEGPGELPDEPTAVPEAAAGADAP